MNMFVNALILALLIPGGDAQKVEDGPACRAELRGTNLMTTVEFPTGLTVEAPWRVVMSEQAEGGGAFMMFVTLDRIIEKDVLTGNRQVVPFPEPVSLAFEGETRQATIHRAAQVWCVTVMRAQQNPALQHMTPTRALETRVALAPLAPPPLS